MTGKNAMRTPPSGWALAAVLGMLLAGCASTPYEGKYAWSEGWRKAEVVAVQTAEEMEWPRFYTCVRKASPEQRASALFAVVKYKETSRMRRHAVLLRPGEKVAAGDAVYVKADDCTTPLVHRAGSEGPVP